MVVTASTCRTETVFDYSWKHVVCAYWNRYPNPSRWVCLLAVDNPTGHTDLPTSNSSSSSQHSCPYRRHNQAWGAGWQIIFAPIAIQNKSSAQVGSTILQQCAGQDCWGLRARSCKKDIYNIHPQFGNEKDHGEWSASNKRADFGTQGDTYQQKLNHMPAPHYLCRKSMKLWFIQSKPMDVHWPCDERISARRSLDSHVPFVLLVSNALRWTATKHRMALTTCCDACSHSISWQQRRQWRRQRGRGQRQRPHRQRLQQHIMATWRWRQHKAIVVKRTHWKRQRKLATSSARRMLAK